MALFFGGYQYISSNYDSAGIVDEGNYSQAYADLQVQEAELDSDVDAIKTSTQGITEAEGNIVLVAWNGLTGLAATIRLFVNVIDVGVGVWNALVPGLAFIPDFAKILMEIGIIITIVLIVIGAFKGEAKT